MTWWGEKDDDNHPSCNQKNLGQSLTTVLVALALVGILITVLMDIFQTMGKAQKSVKETSNVEGLRGGLERILNSRTLCTCNFQGRTFDVTALGTPIDIPNIQIYDNTCAVVAPPQIIAAQGQPIASDQNLVVAAGDIQIQGLSQVQANRNYTGNVWVRVTRQNMATTFGAPTIQASYPIVFSVTVSGTTATIQQCVHSEDLEITPARLSRNGATGFRLSSRKVWTGQIFLKLNDGSIRTGTSPMTWALATGLRDATIAVFTQFYWYYVYAIPIAGNPTNFQLILSQRPPMETNNGVNPPGPTDDGGAVTFPPYKYLGAVLNTAAAGLSIPDFYQVDDQNFVYRTPFSDTGYAISANGTNTLTISSETFPPPVGSRYLVPLTAGSARFKITNVSPGGGAAITTYMGHIGVVTMNVDYYASLTTPAATSNSLNNAMIPLDVQFVLASPITRQFRYQTTGMTGTETSTFSVMGWLDSYLLQ